MNTLYIVPLIYASSYMHSHPRHISVWFALQWSRNQGKIQRISFWIDKNTNFRVQLQRKALLFIIWNFRRRETCTYIEQIGKYRYWISLFLLNLTIRIKELNLCVSLNPRKYEWSRVGPVVPEPFNPSIVSGNLKFLSSKPFHPFKVPGDL